MSEVRPKEKTPAAAVPPAPSAEAAAPRPVPATREGLWSEVLRAAADNRRLISIIEDFRLDRLDGDAAVIVGRGPLVAMARASAEAIGDLFERAGGRAFRIEIRGEEAPAEEAEAGVAAPTLNLQEHPLVKQAMELFGVRSPIRVLPRKKAEE